MTISTYDKKAIWVAMLTTKSPEIRGFVGDWHDEEHNDGGKYVEWEVSYWRATTNDERAKGYGREIREYQFFSNTAFAVKYLNLLMDIWGLKVEGFDIDFIARLEHGEMSSL